MAKKNSTTQNESLLGRIKRGVSGILTPSSDSGKSQKGTNKILSEIEKAIKGDLSDLISDGNENLLAEIKKNNLTQELYAVSSSVEDLDNFAKSWLSQVKDNKFFKAITSIDDGIKSLNKILYSKTSIDNYNSLSSTIQGNKSLVWYFTTIDKLVKMLSKNEGTKETKLETKEATIDDSKQETANDLLSDILKYIKSSMPELVNGHSSILKALSATSNDVVPVQPKEKNDTIVHYIDFMAPTSSDLQSILEVLKSAPKLTSTEGVTTTLTSLSSILQYIIGLSDEVKNVDYDKVSAKLLPLVSSNSNKGLLPLLEEIVQAASNIPDESFDPTTLEELNYWLDHLKEFKTLRYDPIKISSIFSNISDSHLLPLLNTIYKEISDVSGSDLSTAPNVTSLVNWLNSFASVSKLKLSVDDVFNKLEPILESRDVEGMTDKFNVFALVDAISDRASNMHSIKTSPIGQSIVDFLNDLNLISKAKVDASKIDKAIKPIISQDILQTLEKVTSEIDKLVPIKDDAPKTVTALINWMTELNKIGAVRGLSTKQVKKVLDTLSGDDNIITQLVSIFAEISKLSSKNIDNKGQESVKAITTFIDELSKIDNSKIEEISKLKGKISKLQDISKPLAKIIANINSLSKEAKVDTGSISSVMQSIISIGGLDEEGMKKAIKNLRKVKAMTEPHNMFSRIASGFGVGYRGIIADIISNIDALSKEAAANGSKNVAVLSQFLELISKLGNGTFREEDFEDTQEALDVVADMFSEKGVYTKLLSNLTIFASTAKAAEKDIRSAILTIKDGILLPLQNIADYIEKKKLLEVEVSLLSLSLIGKTLSLAAKQFSNISENDIDSIKIGLIGLSYIADYLYEIDTEDSMTRAMEITSMMIALVPLGMATKVASKGMSEKSIEKIAKILPKYQDIITALVGINDEDKAKKKVKPLVEVIVGISLINTVASMSMLTTLMAIPGLWVMSKGIGLLGNIVSAVNDIDDIDEKKMKNMENIAEIVAMSSVILLLGGLVGTMLIPMLPGVLMFTATLSLFLLCVIGAYNLASRGLEDGIKAADQFMELVSKSAIILMVGGLLLTVYPQLALGALGFTVLLATFIAATLAIYTYAASFGAPAIAGLEEMRKLVVQSSLVLMLGGLVVAAGIGLSALGFAGILALFVASILAVYVGASYLMLILGKGTGGPMTIAHELSELVLMSTLSLAIGGVFMMIPGLWKGALGFAGILALFVALVLGTYAGASLLMGGRKGIKIAKEFNKLIVLSAATLLIGGLFMMIPGMAVATLEFAAILGVFLVGVCLAYGFASKLMGKKGALAAAMLSALIAISAITLLTAGMLFLIYPTLGSGIMQFVFWDLLLVAGMSLGVFLLSMMGIKNILIGGLAMAGIIGLIYLTKLAFDGIAETCALVVATKGGWDNIWQYIKYTSGMLIGMSVLVGILGLFASTGMGALVLGAGAAAMLAIIELIKLTGVAMREIALAMQEMNKVKKIDFTAIGENILKFAGLMGPLSSLAGPIQYLILKSATANIKLISSAVGDVGKTIQDFANLTIPVYDENGKKVGVTRMTDSDMAKAAENIAKIVTCLGGAIKTLYDNDKDGIFGNWANSLFNVDTPFTRVCKSCSNMGKIVSDIGRGLQDMAKLKMPIYQGTKVVGYSQMKDEDFVTAATNMQKIILTLGNAVLDLYNDPRAKDMFVDNTVWSSIFGSRGSQTKFGIVVSSARGLGRLVSDITRGLKNVADLKIPIYKGTEIVGYKTIKDQDFIQVANNVEKIITVLAGAIITTYKKHPKMFTDPSKWYEIGNKAPFAMAIKCFNGVGKFISEMAKSIQDIINLKVPVFDGEGNIIKDKYRVLTSADIEPGKGRIFKFIQKVLTAMPAAIVAAYDAHPDWYEDEEDSKMQIMKKACQGMSEWVSDQVKSLKEISELNIDEKSIQSKVNTVLQALPNAIHDLIYPLGKLDSNMYTIMNDTDLQENIKNAYDQYSDAVNSVLKNYDKLWEMLDKAEGKMDLTDLQIKLTSMLQALPTTIYHLLYSTNEKDESAEDTAMSSILKDTDVADNIQNAYSRYTDAISDILNSYKKVSKLQEELSASKKEATIATISDNIREMMSSVSGISTYLSDEDIQLLNTTFVPSIDYYTRGVDMLKGAFSEFPTTILADSASISASLTLINKAASTIKNPDRFTQQTRDIQLFTKAVNNVDLSKAASMTRMVQAIDQMASKLGGLDNLTHTIAEELCVVLEHLTNQLKQSAYTIDKAEKIQKDRHKKIQDSIYKINTLLNNPVNVIVKKEDNMEQYNGGDDQGSQAQNSSSFTTSPSSNRGSGSGGSLADMMEGWKNALTGGKSDDTPKEKTNPSPKQTKGRPGNSQTK